MTYINNSRPALTAIITFGRGVIRSLRDPAVHDAWRETPGDCSRVIDSVAAVGKMTARAADSVARACSETAASGPPQLITPSARNDLEEAEFDPRAAPRRGRVFPTPGHCR